MLRTHTLLSLEKKMFISIMQNFFRGNKEKKPQALKTTTSKSLAESMPHYVWHFYLLIHLSHTIYLLI